MTVMDMMVAVQARLDGLYVSSFLVLWVAIGLDMLKDTPCTDSR